MVKAQHLLSAIASDAVIPRGVQDGHTRQAELHVPGTLSVHVYDSSMYGLLVALPGLICGGKVCLVVSIR